MKTGMCRGFTVVEMMIALLVLSVLLVLSAPTLTGLIKDNRILSQAYALRAALSGARSEALAQRNFVTLCRSSDGASCSGVWNEGYIAFLDVNGDGVVDDPADQLFITKVVDAATIDIGYSSGDAADPVANRLRFDSQGYARGFSGTFTLCDDRGAAKARGVIVTPAGFVRALNPDDPVTCP
jgi:type IV fimbrial biogenesis protein FimT